MSASAMDTPGRPEPGGMLLVHPDGSSFRFDPGALCLELLPTGGPGRLAYFEVLHGPDDVVRWVGESRLPGGLDLAVSPAEVAAARLLRDALWRLAEARVAGLPAAPDDLATVNDAAAHPPLTARLTAEGAREWAAGATGTALLSTVARDAVELFTGAFAHRIRTCGADDCRLLFVDTSRPGRRRWCSMERCGNRHKVRAHRARLTTD
ncbi:MULTISPECIES: ABATE domain-containing protein [unclassified Streptomyces]|uniref:CGNR zinc finger domain-containing protein n=1 Tax=unclassified Streptomyces TaxID=2593676 RepID=UPI001EF06303|nr:MULTISPECIES: ABATE domain-containing protein [unclassified Streptomyces]